MARRRGSLRGGAEKERVFRLQSCLPFALSQHFPFSPLSSPLEQLLPVRCRLFSLSVCQSVARPACLPSSYFASYSFLSAFSRPWRGPPNDRLRDRERRERREERAEGRREDSVRRTDERQRHLSRARPAPRAHGGTIRSGAHSVRFLDLFFILGPFLRNRTACLPLPLSLSPLDSSTISQAFLLRGRAPLLPFRPPARHLLAEARGPFCAPKWGKGRGRRFPRVTG